MSDCELVILLVFYSSHLLHNDYKGVMKTAKKIYFDN